MATAEITTSTRNCSLILGARMANKSIALYRWWEHHLLPLIAAINPDVVWGLLNQHWAILYTFGIAKLIISVRLPGKRGRQKKSQLGVTVSLL